MYEKLTDRARMVMQLANQEAQRLNHEYIGTEHVLLGLLKEGHGTAAAVLRDFGLDLGMIRTETEKIIPAGPDMVTLGKLPQTPRTKKVMEYSMEEARGMNHNYVGTEHILLGLLRENDGSAAIVLTRLGIGMDEVRSKTISLLGVQESTVKAQPPAAIEKDPTVIKIHIDACIAAIKDEDGRAKTRELALAVTKLQEATMWIDEHLRLS